MENLETHSGPPLISIIVATYNRSHFIIDALNSILKQSYLNWECLIIDDGSKDNTKEIVREFSSEDSRFKYFERSSKYKKGLPGSRNMGLDLAIGKKIIFFDDDDIVHPKNLEVNIRELLNTSALFCRYDKKSFVGDWVQEEFDAINFNVEQIGIERIEEMVTGKLPFASCTVMWDRKCFEKERYNEELEYAEEWELYSRILALGYRGISINQILYYNRKHHHSNTGEFYNLEPKRRSSNVQAVKLVIKNLSNHDLLTPSLNLYFIRLGFFLRDSTVIKFVLDESNLSLLAKMKYRVGFKFYPIIRPLFLMKKALKKKKA